jgi:hypothetical protein
MRGNKRTLFVGLLVLLPVAVVAACLAVKSLSRAEESRQIVTPAGKPPLVAEPPTAPDKLENPVQAAVARSLAPPADLLEKPKAADAKPEVSPAEPPLSSGTVHVSPPPVVSNVGPPPGAPAPLPEIRVVSAREPSQPPSPSPEPPISALPLDSAPVPLGIAPKPALIEVKCPWSLHLEVVKGRTVLTAQAGKDARFRIECDQLDLKAPQGSVQARGNVKISNAGLDGSSDRLTVNLQEDQVILEGRAALVARREGENMEVKGERLGVRLVRTREHKNSPAQESRPVEPGPSTTNTSPGPTR